MVQVAPNSIDDTVDDVIYDCLTPSAPKSFFLFAGAGSGKTRSLVNVLTKFKLNHGNRFRLLRKKVAIITYTNAAADEITHRLDHDDIFVVSTIHSFSWELVKNFTHDIRYWLKFNLSEEIKILEEEQSKSRNLNNKTSIARALRIDSKKKRLVHLDNVVRFTYNPNGDNITKDSINHAEVISMTASFIQSKPLMQDILTCKFPIIFVDESQDTKKELVDALFTLQHAKRDCLTLGLFGDTMQRIYSDGKENLGTELPADWLQPAKKMNHRSSKRIINLINDIRKNVDDQKQIPRTEQRDGYVRFFIAKRGSDKSAIEENVCSEMASVTADQLWTTDTIDTKFLILEHHMAANRLSFMEFFEPLYRVDRFKTGLIDGSLSSISLFTKIILPLYDAHKRGDQFSIARIVKANAPSLTREALLASVNQVDEIDMMGKKVRNLLDLWEGGRDPKLIEIAKEVYNSSLFQISDNLSLVISKEARVNALAKEKLHDAADDEEEEVDDDLLVALGNALQAPFSCIINYHKYISEKSKFGTHQGVKGLEYPRVMVIIDDDEARGFMFSYDKLFGTKDLSETDKKNLEDRKESGIDRTRRLFYVACSRAKESLAIVAYSDNPEMLKSNILKFGWFHAGEVSVME
ncbi:UvrD-helicase domain-containing protein [Dyadobacter sp. 676]|uniref:DNA 3'-5' helicase II n=1 Tax=Dyadobacter sp. 676 TaxID=3088362 RepID=A0AAU8FLC6_9BACT